MATRARKLDKSVHSTEQAVFCELMIKARKTADLTRHELAKRLRRPQSFVAKYEGGERRIDVVEFVYLPSYWSRFFETFEELEKSNWTPLMLQTGDKCC